MPPALLIASRETTHEHREDRTRRAVRDHVRHCAQPTERLSGDRDLTAEKLPPFDELRREIRFDGPGIEAGHRCADI